MNSDKGILVGRLRKTQKHVNALQHIFIPACEETAVFIVSSLEEREKTLEDAEDKNDKISRSNASISDKL